MKRSIIVRLISLALMIVMLMPAVPLQVDANDYLGYYWSEDVYKRNGVSGNICKFETRQKDCYGFTIQYCIADVEKGDLKGNFNFEVCVHDTSEGWFVAEMFSLNEVGEEIVVDISWEESRNIDQFAILPGKKNLKLYEVIYVRDLKTEPVNWYWGIPYSYEDEVFWKSGYWTYPAVFEETLSNCRGFTLHYEMDEVIKGTVTSSTEHDVYARASGGSWKKIHSFKLHGDEAVEDIKLSREMDIDEVAVFCMSKNLSYRPRVVFTDAYYDAEAEQEEVNNSAESDGYLSGYWSDSQFKRSGRQSYPFVLDTPIKKCKGFTLDYEVLEVTEGRMKDNCKFVVYYCNSKGTWTKGKEFTLDDDFASVNVKLKKATTVTQVAVHCMNAGQFSYNYRLGVKDPVT